MGRADSYEQRLKDLEKESQRVRKDLRTVSKTLKKSGETIDLPPAPKQYHPLPTTPQKPQPPRESQADAARKPAASFILGQPADEPTSGMDAASYGEYGAEPAPEAPARKTVPGDKRLTSYLSSGSFGKSVPLTRERRVMRARAIFMLLFVALMAALMYHFIF